MMNRILILNPKGGCGKTTVATNLSSYFACQGVNTALLDYDPQGSSMRWSRQRPRNLPSVYAVNASEKYNSSVTRSWYLRVPAETEQVIIDAPAGVTSARLQEHLRNANTILIPVMPSAIDVHAVARFIQELLLQGKVKQRGIRVGIIANRVKTKSVAYKSLCRFLSTIKLPFIASLRDSQYYVAAAEHGIGVHEIKGRGMEQDRKDWKALFEWLNSPEEIYKIKAGY